MKKGIIGAFAMLGLAGMTATTQVNDFNRSVESTGITKGAERSNQNKNQQPTKNQSLTEKEVKAFNRSYLAQNTFQDYGIPPKVYGMHYVKRGTHKRSNI